MKSITNYDIILCPIYNNYNNDTTTGFWILAIVQFIPALSIQSSLIVSDAGCMNSYLGDKQAFIGLDSQPVKDCPYWNKVREKYFLGQFVQRRNGPTSAVQELLQSTGFVQAYLSLKISMISVNAKLISTMHDI